MLLGCMVKTADEAQQAGELRLDYLELKGDMLCVDEASFGALGNRLRGVGLPMRAMTSPLPRRFGCRVVGHDADAPQALAVFRQMCDRAASLGVGVVVLGSGQARSIPAGFPPDRALRQFQDFTLDAAAICQEREMLLALEPLNRTETNLVNSCAQARPVIDGLQHPALRVAVDCFHIVSEGLPVTAEVNAVAGVIGHAHTSSIPRGSNEFRPDLQAEFVSSLRAVGYTGGLTIEDDFADFQRDAARAVDFFRGLLSPIITTT